MSIAIVTGASSGIGRATAVRLAERGTGVILTYNRNADGAREAAAELDRAAVVRLDVGDSATFPAFVAEVADVLQRWGRPTFDQLVNNAGFGLSAPFAETTEAQFDELMRVHLKGPYFLTQQLLPLLADGGTIVNVTSKSAGIVGYSAYASMKAGQIALTRTLANELAPRGIRVNAVAPGPTRTRIAGDAFANYPEVIPPLVAQTALGRLGESDDIAKAIAALVSDDLAWVTGENVEVSGGFNI